MKEGGWRSSLVTHGAVVLAALVGVMGGWLGAREAVQGQLEQQQRQFNQEQDRLEADRRAQVYATYIDAADAFGNASAHFQQDIARLCVEGAEDDCADDPRIIENAAAYRPARFDYQGALNAIYIWGSDEAVRLAKAISASLPASLGVIGGSGLEGVETGNVDRQEFNAAYSAFLDLMCDELPPRPRPGCRT